MKRFLTLAVMAATCTSAFAIDRPDHKTSIKESKSVCKKWASISKKRAVSKLVVVYEGWVSFKQSYADELNQYQDKLIKRVHAEKPKDAGMSFVMNNLVKPNMKSHVADVDYLFMPETSETVGKESVAEACVKSWHKVFGNKLEVAVVSHSFGGNAARTLVQNLNKTLPAYKSIKMLTLDPRSPSPGIKKKFYTPSNVVSNTVIYQRFTPFLVGYPFRESAQTKNIQLDKDDLKQGKCRGNNHVKVTCSNQAISTYLDLI